MADERRGMMESGNMSCDVRQSKRQERRAGKGSRLSFWCLWLCFFLVKVFQGPAMTLHTPMCYKTSYYPVLAGGCESVCIQGVAVVTGAEAPAIFCTALGMKPTPLYARSSAKYNIALPHRLWFVFFLCWDTCVEDRGQALIRAHAHMTMCTCTHMQTRSLSSCFRVSVKGVRRVQWGCMSSRVMCAPAQLRPLISLKKHSLSF